MGYYSYMSFYCEIADLKGLKGLLAEIKLQVASGIATDWQQELNLLYLDDDKELTCEDFYQKWYYEEQWIRAIAPFIETAELEFIGEDSERWGYIIEKRKAYCLEYEKKKGLPL